MLSTFCEIPYTNNYFLIGISVIGSLILSFFKSIHVSANIVKQQKKIGDIKGVGIFSIKYEKMGNHNVALIQGKETCIIIEERVMQELNDKEKEAVYYHELGHLHSISQQSILFIQCFGVLFSAMGLHSVLYGNKHHYIIVIGVIIFLCVEWIKKYVEFNADKYAVSAGCSKEDLVSALSKIEGMNDKKYTIIISGHPKLRKRIKKIMRL
jgi:Zn-dependent protease with chaperone function